MQVMEELSLITSIQFNTPTSLARPGYFLLVAGAISLAAACGAAESACSGGPAITTFGRTLDSLTLVPGIVVEPTRGCVYLMGPASGIETLNIDDGSLLWKSDQADQPLFVAGESLVAIIDSNATGLAVAFLDPASGKTAAKADERLDLPLPVGVTAGIDQTLERTFTHAVRKSDDNIYLTWDFLQRDVTGVAPPGGRSLERRERGAFRYLGDTFEAVAPESTIADPKNWPVELKELFESKQIREPPSRTGNVFAIAEQRYNPERLVLRRWRASDGKPLEEKLLYKGRAVAVLASCDERHVVVATASAQAATERPYVLRYYDFDSGALLAELRSTRSAGPFCIFGSRLLHLSPPEWRRVEGTMVARPLELVAVDVTSGAQVWRRAIRDTAFRGLAPPRN
jgi:hypothetical protein